ncbi:Tetratricopeptide repeat-containing protein [Roseomonas rosea]|uniref:Tetratricopeptide repeat-containing protein n=1 Tax=Muricoccus roseus TaxID=198092 RepID=A0A1M6EXK8_9PROT|nr:tetratricopeptide repeat protein [Roseomonas rosea]SHI90234.1 Tetratricopeptide repeat-containing protein [Roseomonas rosea]
MPVRHPHSARAAGAAPATGLPVVVAGLFAAGLSMGLSIPPAAAQAPAGPGLPPVAFPAAQAPGADAAAGRTASRGSAILLDQANYWSSQGRPELAQQALERLLLLEPNNPDVLATAAEVAALNGERAIAETYVARLNQIAPGGAAARRGAAALRIANVDQAVLADARRLTQAGQREASIQRYREIFPNGEVPDVYAAEYYQTLASVSFQGFLEARAAMEEVVARNPENRPLQLAYAQILVTRETSRSEGIERLRVLARSPDVAGSARAAWRQAILWQGPSGETFAQVQEYLRTFPADPEMSAKLEESRPGPQERLAAVRVQAFELMRTNQRESERLFESALAENADDVDSMIGLAMIRRAQKREAEARQLRDRATELAPDRRDEFLRSLGYVSPDGVAYPEPGQAVAGAWRGPGGLGHGGRGQAGAGTSNGRNGRPPTTGPSLQAWRALQQGKLDEAQELAQRLARGNAAEQADAANLLGQVALRRGDPGTAKLRFRESLNRRPRQVEVQASLYGVLVQQGRFDEADRFAQQSGYRPNVNTQAFRSDVLRDQALRQPEAEQRIALLRRSLAAEPGNVWAAHDLARLLKTRGQQEEARRLERELVRRGTRDSIYAAALLSEYDGRLPETVSRLEGIPAASRTADMGVMLERNRRQLEVRRLEVAARGNPRSPAAERLVALAGQPDPTGATQAEIIRAFNRLRQPENLEAARRAASPDAPATPAPAKAAIAAALADAGREQEAEGLAQRAERDPRLAEDLRRTASAAGRRAAARPAQAGERAAAPVPVAARDPENWRAQLSLARVYVRSDRGSEATELAEGVLRQNPDNVEARSVAGEIAVLRGQIGRAEQILSEGRDRRTDELQMALLEARIARARDDQVRARRALEAAARLRGEQLRSVTP